MAITRTQIAKQLLAQGGRTGFQGGGADMGGVADSKGNVGASFGGGSEGQFSPPDDRGTPEQNINQRNVVREARVRAVEDFINRPTVRERISKGLTNIRNRNIKKFIDNSIRKDLFRSGFVPNSFMGINLPTTLGIASETAYSLFGPEVDSFDEDSLKEIASTLTTTGGSLTKSQSKALESFAKNIANRDELLEKGMTQERFEELYPKPVIDDRDGPEDPCLGPNPPAYCFVGIRSAAPVVKEPEYVNPLSLLTPRIAGTQFAADGGRIGFQGGGKDLGAGASGMGSGGKDRTRDKDGDPRDRRRVEQYKKPPSQTKPDPSVFDKTKALATVPLNFIGSLFGNPFDPKKPIQVINTKAQKDYLNYLANQKEDDTGVLSYDDYGTKFNLSDLKDPIAFSTAMTMGGTGFKKADTGDITYTGGTYDFDGAVPFIDSGGLMGLAYRGGEFLGDKLKPAKLAEGGMASLEDMDREAFLLGGIAKGLKKATRAVKKIAKSPIGKAALIGGLAYFGGGGGLPKFLGGKGLGGFSAKTLFSSKNPLLFTDGKLSFAKTMGLSAILPLLEGKTDDEKEDILNDYFASQELTPSTTKRQAGSEFDFYNYNLAEGGTPRKEPVAKKVMPLLDMGGMEKDYRAEGGFVPIGRMEKADDVPARLSKNEFVFTADAVRNAGEGDVDKGAEVMYNMMKNLEAGGEVSEESQGLDGARKMFQTSQRLGEVI